MREHPRRALVFGWVLVVVVTAGLVIWYVLLGGPAEDRTNRAQVSGTLLAAALIVPPVVVWGWRGRLAAAGTSTRAEVDAAADKLAVQTLETWSRQVVQREYMGRRRSGCGGGGQQMTSPCRVRN